MNALDAIILGIVEGLTEFLPVSSTGHLTIAEKLLGLKIDDPDVTAFTAIIQFGAILSTIVYFFRDIVGMVRGFWNGLVSAEGRQQFEWRLAWCVIVGSLPIAVVGLTAKDAIEGVLRSLWFVAGSLIVWSAVMVAAEWYHKRLAEASPGRHGSSASQVRHEKDLTIVDALLIGLAQCIAVIPGVSRSGATISIGLFRGLDRVTATRMSFFLAIPALSAAGLLEAVSRRDEIANGVGWVNTLIGTVVSFVVAYATIAWLLKFVSRHSIVLFVWYRVALGVVLIIALATETISAT